MLKNVKKWAFLTFDLLDISHYNKIYSREKWLTELVKDEGII